MSTAKSQNDIIRRSEGLLDAADRSPDIQQAIQQERQNLQESLGQTKILKARQEELTALRQEVTQQLTASLGRLKEAAMHFRALVRAKLGLRNERLVHFDVAPLRKRTRTKVVVVEKEKPVNGEPAETNSPSAKPVA